MRLGMIGAVAGVALLAACRQVDSILLVEVGGDLSLMPAQLLVTVTAGGQTHMPFLVPSSPTNIALPTSFTVELDRSITGPVTVRVDVFDSMSNVIASGSTTQTYINTGGETIIAVSLVTGPPP